MNLVFNFPAFTVLISLLCSGIGFAINDKRKARVLSTCLFCACFVMNLCTLIYCVKNGPFTYMMGHYPAPWGNEIRAGVGEALIACFFNVIIALCVNGGYSELLNDVDERKIKLYFVMVNLINASLMALVYTNDIFTGYVFIEICTIASAGILMIHEIGRTMLAATRYMIFSLLGSGLFLIGVILLYDITGHLLMPNILEAVGTLWASGEYHLPLLVVICLISMGIAIKSGMFPFHFWMPDTYGVATPSSSGILSGIISKGYIFLLIKIIFRCFGTDVFYASGINDVLFVCGVCGMIFGSIDAIKENNINRMTAFSSAAQIGYIYMGIGLSPTLGVTAAVFHILTHAVTKPLLFLANGKLALASGREKKFLGLRGAGLRNRVAGVAFTFGALSMVGIPGFMGFISKLLFAQAAVGGSLHMAVTIIALAVSTILNTMYFLRTVITLFTAEGWDNPGNVRVFIRQQPGFAVAAICFMAINVVIGMHSQPIITLIERGLAAL
ncbi:MAG: sodium:proton antiporter [Ruminococcaceae bacterium]|nr:sodium:proton antiporter [Oscillospiraceae bacterium]